MKRRTFLKNIAAAGLGSSLFAPNPSFGSAANPRRFHLCLSADVIHSDLEILSIVKNAGVDAIWMAGFFYGYWPYAIEKLQAARTKIENAGMEAHIVNVPLGHPGDSLGSKDGQFPLTPPAHWRMAQRIDGTTFAGTSLHHPAAQENVEAIRKLRSSGFRRIFLDDDFRLAPAPGQIGGCFCDEHRDRFLKAAGYSLPKWDELLGDAQARRLTPLMRDWVDFTCGELTRCFQEQQKMLDGGELGIMVMYLGSEKAGIRLTDYANAPFRVGELMFDDASFGRVKGKTDELFSALMHRRFVRPERAYSESTAFPAQSLSARNMAAKLAVSTIADVRNTMFMSGITPFPRSHWETLGPAMKIQAEAHRRLAGHAPRGPFKHFWGEASRMIGDDKPFSLFLASGVPFEVVDQPPQDGWTFLSDFDARAAADGRLAMNGGKGIYRPSSKATLPDGESLEESLEALFSFKQRIKPLLKDMPYIVENTPAVCSWHPSAHAALLWNLSDDEKTITLNYNDSKRQISLPGLATALIENFS